MTRIVRLENLQQFTAINVLSDPGAIGGPVVIPQATQVILSWNQDDGKTANNVLVGRYSGAFALTVANADSVLTGLTSGAQWTALASHLSAATRLAKVSFRDINTPNQPLIQSIGAGAPGTDATGTLPNEVAFCLTLRSAFTGPQNRGRLFIPGWGLSAMAGGNTVAATSVTAAANWGSIIAGVLSSIGLIWCIGHPARQQYTGSTGTVHPARPAGTVPITTVVARDNHWDSQRRRGLK